MLVEPSLLGERHQHVNAAHQHGKRQGQPRVSGDGKSDQPQNRGGILRVAAEAVEAVADQAVGSAIGVAEAEVEVSEHGDAKTNKEQRQAD